MKAGHFNTQNVRAVEAPKRPGEGGGADSFDVLVGPRTDGKILGGEISMCLMESCPARFRPILQEIHQISIDFHRFSMVFSMDFTWILMDFNGFSFHFL